MYISMYVCRVHVLSQTAAKSCLFGGKIMLRKQKQQQKHNDTQSPCENSSKSKMCIHACIVLVEKHTQMQTHTLSSLKHMNAFSKIFRKKTINRKREKPKTSKMNGGYRQHKRNETN